MCLREVAMEPLLAWAIGAELWVGADGDTAAASVGMLAAIGRVVEDEEAVEEIGQRRKTSVSPAPPPHTHTPTHQPSSGSGATPYLRMSLLTVL